jgi:hypothetical protein
VPSGIIAGNVYDPTRAAVAGAQLVLINTATNTSRTATISAQGSYEFLQLSPGTYDLSVEAKGFRRTVERQIVVKVGTAVHLDVTLELGSVNETMEVKARPPVIEPDRVSISHVIDPHFVQSLPFQDRQFLNLATIVPGTIPGAPGTRVAGTSLETLTVGGMRSQSNNYTLDGISNNDPYLNGPLNLFRLADAVQEFNVGTSIAGADVGRNSGAQVSIVTKSGGNTYHGSLFYYARDDVLDATPYFLNRAGLPKNPLHRNQLGGTAGGFILRDKTFWFFSFEGFRQSVQDPATARVPTDAERALVTDSISRSLLQFWPRGDTPDLLATTGKNWAGTNPNETSDDTYLWRVDHNLTNNHRLTGRYAWFTGSTLARLNSPFHGSVGNTPVQQSLLVQETYAASRLVNEGRFGFSRNHVLLKPADVNLNATTIFTDTAGTPLPGYIDAGLDPINGGLPSISISGLTNGGLGAGSNFPQGRTTNTYEFLDDVSLVGPWGQDRNILRFGVAVRRETADQFLNNYFRGSISFANWTAFASGQAQRGSLATGAGESFRTWSGGSVYSYALDAFKPVSNLTINFGLRWEYPGTLSELRNRGSNFVPGVGQMALNSNLRINVDPKQLGRDALLQTPVGTWLPASGQFSTQKTNFAPFLGVAYAPKLFGEDKTVIRTGFRLSYDSIANSIPTLMGLNFPPALTTTLPTGRYTWATVLNQNQRLFSPDPTVVPQGERSVLFFAAWPVYPATPYAMNYALEIQRQLGKDCSIDVSYIGSQGRHGVTTLDPNQPTVTVIDPTKRGDQTPNVRTFPFSQYSNILQAAFVSNSNFNELSLVAHKQTSNGLTFTASYELSKSLDDDSSSNPTSGATAVYADSRNRRLDYGLSSFDVHHRVIASFVYELPLAPTRVLLGSTQRAKRQVVAGWTISGITSYGSGYPFTVRASSDTDYTGLNRWTPTAGFCDRANLRPGVAVVPTNMGNPDHAFDPTVFSFPTAGRVGNVGRNTLIGPSFINQDFAVSKDFPIMETRRVQFRVELFNLFNHANFKLPENRLDQSAFGKIGDSYDPRLIQLSARLQW